MEALFYPPAAAFVRFQHLPGAYAGVVYLAGLGLAATGCFPRVIGGSGLAAKAALIADWFGCGYSDRPADFGYSIEEHADVSAWLLDQLAWKGCTVVGHSMGGSVAIMLADKRPDLVARLVLGEANLDAGGGGFSRGIASVTEEQFVADGYTALLHDIRQSLTSEDQSTAAALGMWQVAAPLGLHRSAVSLVAGTRPSWRERLYALTIPRLYVFGEQSLPDQDLEVLPAHGVQTATVSGAGHGMIWENPDGFAAAVLGFLASQSNSR